MRTFKFKALTRNRASDEQNIPLLLLSAHHQWQTEAHCLFVLAPSVTSVVCYSFPFSHRMQRAAGCGARFSLLFPSLRVKSFQLFLPFPLRARLSASRLARTALPSQWTMGPPCSSVSRCGNLGHKPLNCYLGYNKSESH